MSAIADLVTLLMHAGMSPEAIGGAVDLAQQHAIECLDVHRIPPDVHPSTGDKRRAWDRDRKRLQRGLRLPESDWIPLVVKILERDGNACTYCGGDKSLTADHVVPLTRGGTNDASNLTACCLPCNTKKSNKLVSEWLPTTAVKFHADVHPNPQCPPESKKPPLILTSLPSSSEEILKEVSKEPIRARARKRLSPLPENWRPPDIAYALATECGTTVPIVDAIFRDYLKSSGKLYADHDAAFCNFVRNQRKFNGNNSGKENGRRTVHDAARDLHQNLVAQVLAFDEPAPSGLCERASPDVVRLLPPGRRE